MKISPFYFFILVHVASFAISSRVEGDLFCSSFCECDMWYKLRRATCTSRHLYSVQTGVSNTVQALDLSNNVIATLLNYDLKNTGLVNLKYLNLSDNSINEIGSFAFAGLLDLTVLDLSRNHLYYVLWDTFVDTKNLRILHLDGNRFGTRIPDLHSTSITELGLSGCQISHINPQAFAGLEQLRKLDLSNNLMIQMDFRELEPLPFLKDVNLDNNPWSCGDVKQLQFYLEDRRIDYNPICVPKLSSTGKGVKKFEKMIDARNPGQGRDNNLVPEINSNKNIKNTWVIEPPSSTQSTNVKQDQQQVCKNESTSDHQRGLIAAIATISPIWIFAVGFSLGMVTSMIGTYVWLTGSMCSCKLPKIPRRGRDRIMDNSSQRISLLCPGTPPPPYRDVILRSSAYPTAPPTHFLRN